MADRDEVVLRITVPRDQLPTTPPDEYYSQKNCDRLGLDPRRFLELLRRDGAPTPKKLGKLRLVPRDEMLAFMARLDDVAPKAAVEADDADQVLIEVGCAPKKRRAG